MKKSLTTKLVFTSLTLSLVLMLNPAPFAFAGHPGPNSEHDGTRNLNIPACDADLNDPVDVQAFLIDTENGVANDPVGGITTFNFQFVADPTPLDPNTFHMLVFEETWTTEDRSYIIICGLAANTNYQVKKIITHDVPDTIDGPTLFETFDNELLDPCCDTQDDDNDQAAQTFVPIGFSQSNNIDGLSFAMDAFANGFLDRTSTQWDDQFADEFGTIDFLNYNAPGVMIRGEVDDFMTYGLIEKNDFENPFILVERPNIDRDFCFFFPNDPQCVDVGGEMIGVDTTALLVTGAQMNATWLIPLLIGMIAIGIVVARKLRA